MATPIEDLVKPRNTVAAAPEEASEQPTSSIPDEVLQIPAMQALFAGSPAAVSASLTDFAKRPEGKLIQQNKDVLMKAGMGLYRALDGDTGILFNQMYLNGEEIKSADKAGQLAQIAPPFDTVNSEIAKSGQNNPVLNSGNVPNGFKSTSAPSAPVTNVPPASAGVQRTAQRARTSNMTPKGPISGAKPGAGRLLNSILRPVL